MLRRLKHCCCVSENAFRKWRKTKMKSQHVNISDDLYVSKYFCYYFFLSTLRYRENDFSFIVKFVFPGTEVEKSHHINNFSVNIYLFVVFFWSFLFFLFFLTFALNALQVRQGGFFLQKTSATLKKYFTKGIPFQHN